MANQILGVFNVLFSFSEGTVKEGDDINEWVLWYHNDEPVKIGDFHGKWLILYFYPKANTPGCTKEALTYNAQLADFHQNDAEVIGVSTDSPGRQEQFKAKQNLHLRFISDPDGAFAKAFGIKIMLGMCARDTVLVDPKGRVDTIYKGVNPKANAQEVLQYIQSQNLIRQTKDT